MLLELSLACQDTDRTRPLRDGRVTIEGCRVTFIAGNAEEIFQRAFRREEFDISELSLGTHLLTTSRGHGRYLGIPAFVSRSFRHSAIYIRSDRGITSPQDLRGRHVGVPDFQQTAGVWVRGFLADEFGVHARDIHWRTGGLEQSGREMRISYELPAEIDIRPIEAGATLSTMLVAGDIDAIISPRAPSCFPHDPNIRQLFGNYREVEEAYFRKTALFPIMHLIGIRRTLVEAHPWLPLNVYKAFLKARVIALDELNVVDTLRITHPWIAHEIQEVKKVMGENYWPYGVEENKHEIAAILRYAKTDGLVDREMQLDEIFASSTLDEFNF